MREIMEFILLGLFIILCPLLTIAAIKAVRGHDEENALPLAIAAILSPWFIYIALMIIIVL